jgi:very-short-patch-repair endonuclease
MSWPKGKPRSAETREKLSAAGLGRQLDSERKAKLLAGASKPKSEEHKAKIGAALRGRKNGPPSEETRARLRQAATGYHHTPEARAKMSAAHTGKIITPEWRARLSAAVTPNRVFSNTCIERKVRDLLIEYEISFAQTQRIPNVGFVDFYLPKHNRVIECDGDYWHGLPGAAEKDRRRNQALVEQGISILRLPEHRINKDWEAVRNEVWQFANGQ